MEVDLLLLDIKGCLQTDSLPPTIRGQAGGNLVRTAGTSLIKLETNARFFAFIPSLPSFPSVILFLPAAAPQKGLRDVPMNLRR
jgi:hypothetical protein